MHIHRLFRIGHQPRNRRNFGKLQIRNRFLMLKFGARYIDPPHNGHLHNLQAVAAAVQPDLVVLMPAGVPPHKAASATPAALRLEMCEAFRALERSGAVPALQISDWEIRRAEAGYRNYTVSTLQMLAQHYPDARLHLAVGSDMLLTFTTWFHWEEILQMAVLVCQSREIGDAAELELGVRNVRRYYENAKKLAAIGATAGLLSAE